MTWRALLLACTLMVTTVACSSGMPTAPDSASIPAAETPDRTDTIAPPKP